MAEKRPAYLPPPSLTPQVEVGSGLSLAALRGRQGRPADGDASSTGVRPSPVVATPEYDDLLRAAEELGIDVSGLRSTEPGGGGEQHDSDVDGARLIALNMALSGESRADTELYLAEHFQLADPTKLVDEAFERIEER
jgi:hypothetical protein